MDGSLSISIHFASSPALSPCHRVWQDKTIGVSRMLQHYQGVVRENCKRLLRATCTASSQVPS
jgi:hypothetical protein